MVTQDNDAPQIFMNRFAAAAKANVNRYQLSRVTPDAYTRDKQGELHPLWLESTIDMWIAERTGQKAVA